MADDRVPHAGVDVAHEHVDRPAGDADRVDKPFLLEAHQDFGGTAGGVDVLKALRGVLRIVQVDDLQMVQAEQTQAALDRTAGLLAAEVPGLQIAVGFGGQHKAVGQAAQLAQQQPDAALALTVAICRGGIHEVDWTIEHRAEGRAVAILGHRITRVGGQVFARRRAEADRRDFEVGVTEPPADQVIHHRFRLLAQSR